MTPELLATRVRIVVAEVQAGRIGRDRTAVEGYVRKAFTLPADEGLAITMAVLRELNGTPVPEKEERPRSKVKDVLAGIDLIRTGAALFREQPNIKGPNAYRNLLARGYRIGPSLESWQGSIASRARRLATTDAKLPALRPLERAVESGPERRQSKKEGSSRPRAQVARRPAAPSSDEGGPPVPEKVGPPAKVATAPIEDPWSMVVREGDHVLLELAGRKLEATKQPDGWHVEFAGVIPDELVTTLIGRMLGKAP